MLRYIVIAVIVLICIGFLIGYLLLKWKEDGAGIFEKKDGFQGDLADDDIEELEKNETRRRETGGAGRRNPGFPGRK